MKHILLLGNIDGHSVPILRYAGKLCKEFNLKLHILQIEKDSDPILLSSPYYYNNVGLSIDLKVANKKKELEAFVQSNTKDLIETDWLSHKLMHGNIQNCLDKFINEEKIDLLLVRKSIFEQTGIHQNNIFSKLFMNVSDIPIMIIPKNQVFKKLQRMVYFTNFSEDDFNNIQWLTNNFPNLQIDLIHFSKEEESLQIKKWINYLNSEIDNINITYKRLEDNIKNFIMTEVNKIDTPYDFLSMITHKRNFWKRFTDPSTTLSLISNLEVPALIFKYSK